MTPCCQAFIIGGAQAWPCFKPVRRSPCDRVPRARSPLWGPQGRGPGHGATKPEDPSSVCPSFATLVLLLFLPHATNFPRARRAALAQRVQSVPGRESFGCRDKPSLARGRHARRATSLPPSPFPAHPTAGEQPFRMTRSAPRGCPPRVPQMGLGGRRRLLRLS